MSKLEWLPIWQSEWILTEEDFNRFSSHGWKLHSEHKRKMRGKILGFYLFKKEIILV